VPTPLNRNREPDMTYVEASARALARQLRPGQLAVLESTTYPGTSDELIRPILEETGLASGTDFYLAYSPEREDPGNKDFATGKIPKVVGGDGADALKLAQALYDAIVPQTVPVRDLRTAEAVKLTENIFRSVNIALVNELKQVYGAMDIDVWEVIDAAKTKPFGFMPFYPGPGLGGHCIPIDPFYLTWKAREYEMSTRFIELAGDVNVSMPRHVVYKLSEALNARQRRALNGAHVLLVGLAYKKNVDDPRESPSFKLLELLSEKGTQVAYHDPHIPRIPSMRDYPQFAGIPSTDLTSDAVAAFDAVLIATDHDDVDYATIAQSAALVVDTRNALAKRGLSNPRVVKA
jgi:UDP-N-acetyl-D-glucosamine dehydrogenase